MAPATVAVLVADARRLLWQARRAAALRTAGLVVARVAQTKPARMVLVVMAALPPQTLVVVVLGVLREP